MVKLSWQFRGGAFRLARKAWQQPSGGRHCGPKFGTCHPLGID
ncbi:hypothetical protein RBWH47_02295 [Rhodopirellula baltica WH47]|uniref:Uncharacterized protein n=1 Tax=Rhodopirellula baltica WH47 TaxID=991778 RepID=F2AZ38_RHOBT|nr:hypothetical protein RBWH47_02295 [Rhodopirellula baltica WH47]